MRAAGHHQLANLNFSKENLTVYKKWFLRDFLRKWLQPFQQAAAHLTKLYTTAIRICRSRLWLVFACVYILVRKAACCMTSFSARQNLCHCLALVWNDRWRKKMECKGFLGRDKWNNFVTLKCHCVKFTSKTKNVKYEYKLWIVYQYSVILSSLNMMWNFIKYGQCHKWDCALFFGWDDEIQSFLWCVEYNEVCVPIVLNVVVGVCDLINRSQGNTC